MYFHHDKVSEQKQGGPKPAVVLADVIVTLWILQMRCDDVWMVEKDYDKGAANVQLLALLTKKKQKERLVQRTKELKVNTGDGGGTKASGLPVSLLPHSPLFTLFPFMHFKVAGITVWTRLRIHS